jgi:hypothetical protein
MHIDNGPIEAEGGARGAMMIGMVTAGIVH